MVLFESGLQESKQTLWKDLHPDRQAARQHSRRNYNKFLLPLLTQESSYYIPSTKFQTVRYLIKGEDVARMPHMLWKIPIPSQNTLQLLFVVSGSSPYPITRQAREKNPKKPKNKKHPLSEIYLYDTQEKNQ